MNTDRCKLTPAPSKVDNALFAPRHHRQRGMSSLGLLAVVLMVLFFILSSVKMIPLYVQNWTVQTILTDIHDEFEGNSKPISKSDIKTALLKRFSVNQLDHVIADSIDLEKKKNGYIVTVNYEIRVSLIGNIDAVVLFDQNTVDISRT